MEDFLQPNQRGPRPSSAKPGFAEQSGYWLPSAATFTWRDLVEVAHANGFRLSHDLLKKWRVWRFLPEPKAGGASTSGRGKGETWSREAGWRCAWISRWQADRLTYDLLRLAIWLWTPGFERSRADDVRRSVVNFLRQDADFHSRVYDEFGSELFANSQTAAYQSVIMAGHSELDERRTLLDWAGLAEDDPRFQRNLPFFEHLNLEEMTSRVATVTSDDVRAFIAAFRTSIAHEHKLATQELWRNPIGVARIVVRELYRYLLSKDGVLELGPAAT